MKQYSYKYTSCIPFETRCVLVGIALYTIKCWYAESYGAIGFICRYINSCCEIKVNCRHIDHTAQYEPYIDI